MVRRLLLALALCGVAACKIDSTTYVHPDGGGGGDDDASTDAPPAGPRVLIDPFDVTVGEGAQVVVHVRLSEAPPASAPIMVTPTDSRLTAAPTSLTFTAANWNVERIVTLMAASDDDAADNPVTVVFDGGGVVGDGSAAVMITDDDQLRVIVTPAATLGVTEQGSAPVQLRLSARPTGNVQVAVSAATPGIVGLNPASVTFTTGNWDTDQAVVVTGLDDANTMDDTTLLVVDPVPDGIDSESLMVTVTDNDVLNIEATPANLGTLTEGNATPTPFTVKLTQMPAATVTVNLTVAAVGAVNLNPSTLTFTTSNWATPQTVNVTAPEDPDVGDESVTISLAATGLTTRTVTATIADNDTQAILTTLASIALTEGTGTNLGIHLAFAPEAPIVMTVTPLDPSVASVDIAQLTFTDQNYSVNQTVRVTALDDANLVNGATTLRLNLADVGLSKDLAVTVTDDDTQAIVVDRGTVAITEGGSATVKAHLAFEPAGAVTVSVASSAPTKIGVAPASLTFDSSDYTVDQAVTISGVEDADLANESGTVTLSATGIPNRTINVTVADNDAQDIVVMPTTMTVVEGSSSPLMVKLGAQPAGAVTVTLTTNPTGVVNLGQTQLTFDQGSWNTFQMVAVSAPQDPDVADGSTTITLSATGLSSKSVAVTVDDDDVLTAIAGASSITVTEGAPPTLFSVRLSHNPGGAVVVSVGATTNGLIDFTPTNLSYDQNNWMNDQVVQVSARPDDDNAGGSTTLQLVVQGGATTNVGVTVVDTTIVVGWPPPHTTFSFGPGQSLHAFRAVTPTGAPPCFFIEKILVNVASVPMIGMPLIRVALYSDAVGVPSALQYGDPAHMAGVGTQTYAVGRPVTMTWPTWIAVETTGGVQIKNAGSGSGSSAVPHCERLHAFNEGSPNPFDYTISGSGSSVTPPSCGSAAPPGIWVIGHQVDPLNCSSGTSGI